MAPKILLLCAAFFLAMMMPAQAARFSGEYLLYMCASDKNGKELVPGGHIACQSYISGVLDYHNLIRSLGTSPTVDFCIPENVDMNALQLQVYSYMFRNRSEHNGFVAAPGVAMAFLEYYPCKGAKTKLKTQK
jgi:hypothetical protein